MNQKEKRILNCIVYALIIATAILTVVRICTDTTANVRIGVAGQFDDYTHIRENDSIEFEAEAPVSDLTGFSFRFIGNRDDFGNTGFLVTAVIQDDASDPVVIYESRVELIEQAYDYQNASYIVIIPFEQGIQQGDYLSITIAGMGIPKEAGIYVKQTGAFYYQTNRLDIVPILVQGIVFALLIVLAGELIKKKKETDKDPAFPLENRRIPFKKIMIRLLPVVIFLIAALEYTCYAGIKKQVDGVLPLNLALLFLAFSSVVVGLTLIVFVCGLKTIKLEKLLFLTIVCLGILFEIVITPFAVPDEASHIDTVYRISNRMLGTEDTGISDAIYKRECDIYTDSGVKRTISGETYQWIYNDWSKTGENEKLIFAADNRGNANSLFFIPAALSMTVGRILGIGFLPIIFLIRTANLLFAAWLIYLAVKKLPYGKSILCMTALLPITLQELAACTYDALIIPVSMLFVSYCVFAISSEKKLEKVDILVIVITAIMIGICKGGVYTPLYLLGIWILVKRGYIRWPQKKGIRTAIITAAACAVLFGIIGVVYIYMQPVDSASLNSGRYSLTYLIQHPRETFRIIENSLYKDTYYYFEQLFGKAMGSFQMSIKFIVPIGYIILMGKSVVCGEKYPYIPKTADKCIYMTTAVLVFAAVQAAFLLVATAFGSHSIGGIQGRYFLPAVWVFLICFRRESIADKNKNYTRLVLAGYLLGICTVLQIMISAFNPSTDIF